MRVLHIFRSPPTPDTLELIKLAYGDDENSMVRLDQGGVDYEALVKQIFASTKVVSWW